MDLGPINWLAVVVCVVVSMISGSLWFNPKTFYPTWWKAIGRSERDAPGMQNMGMVWGLTVLSSFVQAVSVALMINTMGGKTLGVYYTMGEYDLIAIGEFPNDEIAMTFLLRNVQAGTVRTTTLKAFTVEQFSEFVKTLP